MPKTSSWTLDGKLKEIWQFILSKIIKIIATSGPILRLKCTKFNFGTSWRAYSAPQTPLAALKGAYL